VLLLAEQPSASPNVELSISWPSGLPTSGEVSVTIDSGADKLDILGGSSTTERTWSAPPYPVSFEVKAKAVSSSVNDVKINVQHSNGAIAGLELTVVSVRLKEFGFKNDQAIKSYQSNQWIDSPDGSVPTWKRLANPNLPANYVKNAPPSIFGKLEISPVVSGQNLSLRAKEGQANLVMISSGLNLSIAEPTVPQTNFLVAPANSSAVRGTTTILAWEASIDGNTWAPIGSSSHLFYWSEGIVGSGVTVYDRALEKACGYVNGVSDIPGSINIGIAADIIYNPGEAIATDLLAGYSSSSSGLQCEDHAKLFQLLLETIGSPSGSRLFYWGGTQQQIYLYKQSVNSSVNDVSFKSNRPATDGLPSKLHFLYHVQVKIGSITYDPSYGTTDPLVAEFLHPEGSLQQGSTSDFSNAGQYAWPSDVVYQGGEK
jgi:hypothetical protein